MTSVVLFFPVWFWANVVRCFIVFPPMKYAVLLLFRSAIFRISSLIYWPSIVQDAFFHFLNFNHRNWSEPMVLLSLPFTWLLHRWLIEFVACNLVEIYCKILVLFTHHSSWHTVLDGLVEEHEYTCVVFGDQLQPSSVLWTMSIVILPGVTPRQWQ